MMSHIIYLLLIASSPIYTLGDGSGSWGSLSSGPSESECRPFIEKALQGAAGQDPPPSDQPMTIDDVGDTGQGEENLAPSETSETLASETPSDGEGAGESEVENQQESVATEEPESTEEHSGEAPLEHEEDNTEPSGETQKESEETEGSAEIPTETIEESEEAPTETASNEEEEHQPEESNEGKNADVTEESLDNESEEALKETSADEANQDNGINADEDVSATEGDESVERKSETEDNLESKEETGSNEEVSNTEGNETAEDTTTEEKSEEIPIEGTAEDQIIDEPETSNEENAPSSLDSNEAPEKLPDDEIVQKETEEIETSGELGEESKETSEPIEPIDKESELTSDEATESSLEESPQSEENKEVPIEKEVESPDEVPAEVTSNEANDENLGEIPSDEPAPADGVIPENDQPEPVSEEQAEGTEAQSEVATKQVEDAEKQPDSVEEPSEEIAPEKEESTETEETSSEGEATESAAPEEELTMILEIPENLRSRDHMAEILRLNEENEETEKLLGKTIESTLRDLKKLYDAAIKPLEILYKYRDLSNRHFGDPEIFSKPLILFMGPWSGGKSTIINYLLENEYKTTALRSGAEPSPAYFNIVMWGDREEILDGTQLAADWTFSGLQKFGQGLLDRLRGLRLNHPLLQKVNIVEIPGILEIRKQVERLFPFNDACQWFIDRADIIFLVYDPSKLDVGPETEAILDQLKGREMQTRIILNKADQVKPEELMRVQGTLIWNISPLMSSTEPPVLYSASLWSLPYEVGAPTRLLYAQERLFLKDLRDAIDKRVENKIASARRFAVRVRNHAKMVDCYLTTYYNHKSFFGNKKKISDDIIEHPQNYHIYEGLSTLTNISRYDLPDPDVYKDFFRLNPVYEFQQLASTCTYFRGCPINRLDVAIAYDLPELVGRYKKQVEDVLKSITK